ncbi:unnamed protein product [Owenia fusiformis]|uniref:Uncharacterized protein n=1 Tax=Owenia fusiformis TaxID=6347 RepID=A0A8J1XFM1_OWEFU|nr:unnamed protein product [Owenia fusiformis]
MEREIEQCRDCNMGEHGKNIESTTHQCVLCTTFHGTKLTSNSTTSCPGASGNHHTSEENESHSMNDNQASRTSSSEPVECVIPNGSTAARRSVFERFKNPDFIGKLNCVSYAKASDAVKRENSHVSKRYEVEKLKQQETDNSAPTVSEKGDTHIGIHKYTDDPCTVYEILRVKRIFQQIPQKKRMPVDTPIFPDKVRFVCISDTHSQLHKCLDAIPPGDVLIHAGDFSNIGRVTEIMNFNKTMGSLSHKHKVLIAGNHEITFDEKTAPGNNTGEMRELITSATYLQDKTIELYGINIYGAPWAPEFGINAFGLPRGEKLLEKWQQIPSNTDVLITHGPPLGHCDLTKSMQRAGCVELLNTIQFRVKPKFHIFGHIHEAHGMSTDGTTTYINASICNLGYKTVQSPIIFDIPLPEGVCKEDF